MSTESKLDSFSQFFCPDKSAEVLYMYSCVDSRNSTEYNSFIKGCDYEAKVEGELLDDIKRHAYVKQYPSFSYSNAQIDGLTCDVSKIRLNVSNTDAWLKKGITSSCGPEYDNNKATIINDYVCHYHGERTDANGNKGVSPNHKISGRLFSCDLAPMTSDELMDDIRRHAYHRMGGKSQNIDEAKFECSVFTMPL